MNRFTLSIQYILLFIAQLSFAQEQLSADYVYTITHYNTENGLSHNAIYNIKKDQNNNLIAFTRAGLDEISSRKVKNLQAINPTFTMLDQNKVDIIPYNSNSYLFANRNHLFNITEDQFTHIDFKKDKSPIFPFPIEGIRDIFKTENDKLFVLTNNLSLLQLHKIDSSEVLFNSIKFEYSELSDYTYIKLIDDRWLYINQTLVNKDTKLYLVDLLAKTLQQIKESTALKEQFFPLKFWGRKSKHLKKHSDLNSFLDQELKFYSFSKKRNPTLYDSYSKLFWYIEDHILHGFHPVEGLIHQISLPKVFFNDNMEFSDGTIWLSSPYDGIYQVKIEEKKFKSIVLEHKGGPRNIIQDFQNRLWLTGIGITDPSNKHKLIENSLKINATLIFLDQAGFIWTAKKHSKTLLKYNEQFELVQTFTINVDPLRIKLWAMAEDKDGTVWVAGKDRLIGIQANNEIQEIPLSFQLPDYVYQILIEDSEFFWLSTNRGLFQVHRSSGKLIKYGNDDNKDILLPATAFHYMYQDKDSICWLATGDSGLLRWDRKIDIQNEPEKAIKIYDTSFGFPSNILHAIYEDKNGFLWISSEYGIIQFHKHSEYFNYFLEKDGIANNEFNRSSHFRDDDGNIFFGGVKGVTKFHPKDFLIDTVKSDISILSLQRFNNKRYIDYLNKFNATGKIEFETQNDFFLLQFQSSSSDENVYQYFYTYDELDWVPTSTYSVDINNLSPGTHQLRLKKENLVGDVLGQLSIPIVVPKPFYLEYWFFALVILSLISLVYLLFKLQSKNYKYRQAKLESLVRERTKKIEQDKILIEHQAQTLEHLHNKKSSLFKNIAHELRNPLTLIFGATKMLEKQVAQIQDKRVDKKYLTAITSSGDKILSLTDEVLFLAKLEADTQPIHLAPITLFLLFDKIIKQFKVIAEFQNKELHFNSEINKDLVIQLDAVKAEKIFTNLLSNAFKYTPKGAKITLTVFKEQDHFVTEVSDTGYGILEKELPLIFEPFYRSERITQKYDSIEGTGGTGIGLSIVQKLATLLDGSISVESKVNQGSTFTVRLPLLPASKEQQTDLIHSDQEDATVANDDSNMLLTKKNHHILIVDDHPGVINFLKDLLESNYMVSVASNGKSAIEVIQEKCKAKSEQMISLIICDIMMPEMDGIQFAEQLKKHAKWKWIPILFLTGYNDGPTKQHALRIGIEDYLIKPFDPDELKLRIVKLLNNKRSILFSEASEDSINQPSFDTEWINQFNQLVQNNIENINLDVDFLANKMSIGKRQLTRKIKQHTGLTPGKYVQEVRLQKARILLENKTYYSVSAVAYSAGFKSPKYFSKQFRERFGRLPSSYYK